MSENSAEGPVLALEEDNHWWFASRTRALFNMIDGFVPDRDRRILEIGRAHV